VRGIRQTRREFPTPALPVPRRLRQRRRFHLATAVAARGGGGGTVRDAGLGETPVQMPLTRSRNMLMAQAISSRVFTPARLCAPQGADENFFLVSDVARWRQNLRTNDGQMIKARLP
jgi:hypothetical protein